MTISKSAVLRQAKRNKDKQLVVAECARPYNIPVLRLVHKILFYKVVRFPHALDEYARILPSQMVLLIYS